MQPLTASPRLELDAATVMALIQDAPALTVSAGLELLDQDLMVKADLSDWLLGGSVARSGYAELHGTAQLAISTELDWGQAIVRPNITLTDGVDSATFRLGAYYTSSPRTDLHQDPAVHDVAGYDILHGLHGLTGEVYAVDQGTDYLTAVETVLVAQGYTAYFIDQTAAGTTLPTPRVWPLDAQTRWVHVVNDLLGAVGYQGIWSDWDGRLICQPYQPPRDRGPEWTYNSYDPYTSMMTPQRSILRDYYAAPNRWLGVRSNNTDGPAPIEGDGIYKFTNEFDGPTSVAARGGRVITAEPLFLDVADQAALEALVHARIDADLRLATTITAGTGCNPLHWHFDRLYVDDTEIGAPLDVLSTQWTLPLDGGNMGHEWSVL